MKRTTLEVGAYAVNCSLLAFDDHICWIVDPGAESDRIAAAVAAIGCVPTAILLTHAHFDHIGAIPGIQHRWPEIPVYVHPEDAKIITHPFNQSPEYPPIETPSNIRDPRTLEGVTTLETPGHTPGGVCYWFPAKKLLLSGDTLFAGSVGRTDFPGGDMGAMMRSLAKLRTLPEDTEVVPGHGPSTTIGFECRGNPYLLAGQ